jgi:CheY-like chemotaxis protein
VLTISSASDALQCIADAKPDVMVVDRGMPQMEGVESIECIRASSDADIRDIPAAALTAFARSEDRTTALDHGFEMHYAEPVDPANSFPRSRQLVRRRSSGR